MFAIFSHNQTQKKCFARDVTTLTRKKNTKSFDENKVGSKWYTNGLLETFERLLSKQFLHSKILNSKDIRKSSNNFVVCYKFKKERIHSGKVTKRGS